MDVCGLYLILFSFLYAIAFLLFFWGGGGGGGLGQDSPVTPSVPLCSWHNLTKKLGGGGGVIFFLFFFLLTFFIISSGVESMS